MTHFHSSEVRELIYEEQLDIFFPGKPSRLLYNMLDNLDFDSMAKGLDPFSKDEGGGLDLKRVE
jgi:hypothetical protein